MLRPLARILYQFLLWLHPRAFREEFADEMLWIFGEVRGAREVLPLFGDALWSLSRQWALRWLNPGEVSGLAISSGAAAASGALAWERIAFPEGTLPPWRMLQGALVSLASVALMNAMLFPANFGPGKLPEGGGAAKLFARGATAANLPRQGSGRGPGLAEFKRVLRGDLGQAEPQQAEAERQFNAWLEAFNSGDRAKLLAFLQANDPAHANRIDGQMEFRSRTGGFELKKVEESDAAKFVAVLKEHDSDQFARLVLETEAEEPHHIRQFGLMAIATPPEFALPRMSEADALAALRTEIEKESAADRFAGTVLVAKNGKAIFTAATGLSDREKKTPNKLATQFRIGSMNKMFTAVSVLQLVQAEKIKLTDPLGKYLTDYPNKEIASKVTIHQLLTHTGGTGDFFGPEFDKHRLELKTLQDYVKLYGQRGPAFEPGSRWEYSNYGFLLLGVLVEKVSGQNYYEYVAEHVYKPAGMTATASLAEDQMVANRSTGYTKMDGTTWRPNTDTLPYRGTSAGGGYSTVEDLFRFANALENHKLLDAEHTALLTTGKVDTPMGGKYAYGFGDNTTNGVRCFGHGGGAPGMNGDLQICESGYVVAVLANLDPPAAQRISTFALNRLPGK